jgi:MFS family permease
LGRTDGAAGDAGQSAPTRLTRNAPLRRLQISTAATSLGKWAFGVTLAVYAFREGGTAAIGLVALIQAVPATFAAPVFGLAGDRYPRQRVLLATNLARALLLAAVAAATLEGLPVAVVFVLAALFSTISTANQPARAALIPVLARSPGEVASATAVMGTIDTSSFLVGAGVGGIVLASTSVPFVVGLCCMAYLVASAVILGVPVDTRPAPRRHERPMRALAAGLHTVLDDEHLRLVVVLIATLSIIDGLMGVLVIVTPIRLLHIGTAGIGYLNIARGAGGLIGGTAALVMLGRSRVAVVLGIGALALGGPLTLLGILPHVAIALLAWVTFGLGYVLVKVSGLTLVQRLSGDRVLARVLAVLETTFVATLGLGAVLASVLVSLVGVRAALIVTGVALPAVTAIRWFALRRLEIGAPVPLREFELLRRCPVLAPLPLATVEGLARRVVPVEVPAGVDVITQGDHGDRFYLIADGAVEVLEDGIFKRSLGAGESFGEVALLHDITRTATVRASEPTRLVALDREPFLVSVTGHADSHDAAVDVAAPFLRPTAGSA